MFFTKSEKPSPHMMVSYWFYLVNTTPKPMFVCWVVFMSFQVWYVISNRLVIIINFVDFCIEFICIFVEVRHRHKMCLHFHFQCNFLIYGLWVVYGKLCSVWASSDELNPLFEILELYTFEKSWQREIHHWFPYVGIHFRLIPDWIKSTQAWLNQI